MTVIENNKIALDAIGKSYREIAMQASEINDFRTESWAMTSGMLLSCRVDILTQYSLLLTMVSLLEESVNTLCRIYHNVNQLPQELKDIKGSGLERAAKYLKEVVGIKGFTTGNWEYISGNIMPAKREMDALKKKVEKFISLGGQGKHLSRLEDIDEAIEIIKYLKERNCLNRQQEFLSLGLLLTQSTLERELCEEIVDEEDGLPVHIEKYKCFLSF